MRLVKRLLRHGLVGTLKLVPVNSRHFLRGLSPSVRVALRKDRQFDRRYGTLTNGVIPLGALDVADEGAAQATWYEPISTDDFAAMMRLLPRELGDFRFVDYGSGRGRALLLASCYPLKEVVGLEFSKELHQTAEMNLRKFRPPERICTHVRSLLMDATQYELPLGPSVLFFFNPFGHDQMARILRRIEEVHSISEYPLYVLYEYPEHQELLASSPFWTKLGGSGGQWSVFGHRASGSAAQRTLPSSSRSPS